MLARSGPRSGLRRAVSALCPLLLIVQASAPAAYAAPAVLDGTPTADACREVGIPLPETREERTFTGSRIVGPKPASAAAAPPPAPPPVMSSSAAVSEVVVTTSRTRQPALKGQSAPVAMAAPAAPAAGFYAPSHGTVDTERYPQATPNPVKRVADQPVSTFSIDVDTAAYANVRRMLNQGARPPHDAVRVEELVNYFDYAYPRPTSRDEPFRPFVAVTDSPWSKGKQIVHIGLQGYEIPRTERPPLNLVFLIDVSGSMWDEDKLPLVKQALNVLIDQLRPQDSVAIAVYAGAAGEVLPPTKGTNKLKMRCAIQAMQAGGSTAGGAGLALAYKLAEAGFDKDRVNRVVLMTDGDFNVGVADPRPLQDFVADKRKTGVYLSVYGFGQGNYNDTMMQSLAQSGNGTAGYVDGLIEAKKLFHDDFAGSIFPIADDVKIQVEFNPARVSEYRLIGYETRLLNREDFNNDSVDAGEVGSGTAVTALYEITPVGGASSVDPLRYQKEAAPKAEGAGELAFLKVRYKLPGGQTSRLIERPIGDADRKETASEATRWALAVAAYGQKLRGDPWIDAGYGWREVADLARSARGEDPYGMRDEFLGLVGKAEGGSKANGAN